MKNSLEELFEKTANAIKNWWLLLILGILLVALGVVVFFFPNESYYTLAVLFGIMMLASGTIEMAFALSNRSFFVFRGWNIAAGVMNILLGIVLCCNPHISGLLITFLLGFWMMSLSFTAIGCGGDLIGFHIPGSGWTLAGGILLMLLSFIIFLFPDKVGTAFIVVLIGISLIVSGINACYMAFRLKNVHKSFKEHYTDYEEIE